MKNLTLFMLMFDFYACLKYQETIDIKMEKLREIFFNCLIVSLNIFEKF